jgi:hypothetical protein
MFFGGGGGVPGGADCHRLARHSTVMRTRLPGARGNSLTSEMRLTHPIPGGAQCPDQNSLGVEPTHLLGVLQRLPVQRNHAHPTSIYIYVDMYEALCLYNWVLLS